ncbi:MAG: O-antigen ligase family protein [Alphaproteobacteria bacterium]|jgi:exopolysaccharide production protein ExoQ|nr:O-antigen ligase family protein [Alphaproteobacteria bacterium]MBT5859679.1 O-antigen ligase family protein [Alphaproteobacteria bacterium]
MPAWGKNALGLGAFAVLPVAVLSSQGLTLLMVLVGLGTLISGDWKRRRPITAVLILLGTGVAWAALTSLWAVTPKDALNLAGSLAVLFIVIVLLMDRAQSATPPQRTVIGTMLVAGFAFGAGLLAIELLADLPLAKLVRGDRTGQDNLELSLLNPALTVLVLMVWPVGFTVWQRWKPAAIIVPVVVVVMVWLGTSVTAWIAIVAGAGAFALVTFIGPKGARGLGFAAAVAVLAAPMIAQVVTPDRVEQLLDGVRPSAIHRIYTWEFTADRIAEHPFVGWGLDSSRAIPGGQALVVEDGPALSLHPHNAPLQIWLELGLPGAVILAVLLLVIARGLANLPRPAMAPATAAFAAAFVFASLSFGIWQNWWVAALGVTAVLCRAVIDAPPKDSPQ